MSALGQLRKAWDYETNVPRCSTCVHFRPARWFLIDSLPRQGQAMCVKAPFTTRPNAVCKHWTGADGAALVP